jgi:hypothetical protein
MLSKTQNTQVCYQLGLHVALQLHLGDSATKLLQRMSFRVRYSVTNHLGKSEATYEGLRKQFKSWLEVSATVGCSPSTSEECDSNATDASVVPLHSSSRSRLRSSCSSDPGASPS